MHYTPGAYVPGAVYTQNMFLGHIGLKMLLQIIQAPSGKCAPRVKFRTKISQKQAKNCRSCSTIAWVVVLAVPGVGHVSFGLIPKSLPRE